MNAPAITILDAGAPDEVLREVCAGAEEQGVPTEVLPAPARPGSVAELAHTAAARSRLEVGIGLLRDGSVAVQHATLPSTAPAMAVEAGMPPAACRSAGRTAARIVTRLPLTPA